MRGIARSCFRRILMYDRVRGGSMVTQRRGWTVVSVEARRNAVAVSPAHINRSLDWVCPEASRGSGPSTIRIVIAARPLGHRGIGFYQTLPRG